MADLIEVVLEIFFEIAAGGAGDPKVPKPARIILGVLLFGGALLLVALGLLFLYAGIDTGNGKLLACGLLVWGCLAVFCWARLKKLRRKGKSA